MARLNFRKMAASMNDYYRVNPDSTTAGTTQRQTVSAPGVGTVPSAAAPAPGASTGVPNQIAAAAPQTTPGPRPGTSARNMQLAGNTKAELEKKNPNMQGNYTPWMRRFMSMLG